MMNQPRYWSRRSVNALIASVAAWPCHADLSVTRIETVPAAVLQHKLVSLFDNPRNTYAIGAACLKSLPSNASSPQQLTIAILAALECNTETIKTKEAIRHRIANRVRNEFATGVIINVEGWILSLTEARLYALAALNASRTPMCEVVA